jgi:dolichyl-phosphate beta-glucosyltransferase
MLLFLLNSWWPSFLLLIGAIMLFFILSFEKRTGGLTPEERYFVDPSENNTRKPFPLYYSGDDIYLTIVVPAYNEEKRLGKMMDETLEYLKSRAKEDPNFTWEIVIVNDGSSDHTTEVALNYVKRESAERVRLLVLSRNRGKGGAIKRGVIVSRGRYILMADADGATEISELKKLENELRVLERDGHGIACGSRHHLVDQSVVTKRSFFRNLLMWGFHFCVSTLCVSGIKDTQCGFKLFTRKTAQLLFSNLHLERWAFDVELLFLAQHQNIPVSEIAVNWTEVPGSKLDPLRASFEMGRDLLKIRFAYLFGIWKFQSLDKIKYL